MSKVSDSKNAKKEDLEKIAVLFERAYRKAMSDDENAMQGIDRCLALMQRKTALEASNPRPGGVAAAFEKSVKLLREQGVVTDVDAALIALGRTTAKRIDNAVLFGSPEEVTKALYLGPHIVNVLSKLGATPEARGIVKEALSKDKPGVASLSDWKKQKKIG